MDIDNSLGKVLNNVSNLGNMLATAQEKFTQSNLYGIFDTALDAGIKIALPNVVEDAAIDIKDALLENGFKEGAKQIWSNIKEYAKSTWGIVSGKFDSLEQVQIATKTGGVLDNVSKIFDYALDKAVDNGKITKSVRQSLKTKKNSIVKDIKNKVSEDLDNQVVYVERIHEYCNKWQECFENEDLKGMKNANKNIQKYLEKVLPMEDILKNARKIEIMQNLVENTESFDITEEEMELAGVLAQ